MAFAPVSAAAHAQTYELPLWKRTQIQAIYKQNKISLSREKEAHGSGHSYLEENTSS